MAKGACGGECCGGRKGPVSVSVCGGVSVEAPSRGENNTLGAGGKGETTEEEMLLLEGGRQRQQTALKFKNRSCGSGKEAR
jgi:hypothetical protein